MQAGKVTHISEIHRKIQGDKKKFTEVLCDVFFKEVCHPEHGFLLTPECRKCVNC